MYGQLIEGHCTVSPLGILTSQSTGSLATTVSNSSSESSVGTRAGSGIDDQPPDEGEVVAALKKLKLGKSPGASGIRVEDLREWHRLAREIEEEAGEPLEEDVEIWEKVLKCSPKCCD